MSGPDPAAATSGKKIVRMLNKQRSHAGIPGHLRQNRRWSRKCALHNRYMAKTGDFAHSEKRGSRWYTRGGAWAARNGVLAYGGYWAAGNPFNSAPLHLAQLMAPGLSVVGVNQSRGYTCVTTWPGYKRKEPKKPRGYSYPGPGAKRVPAMEAAMESPFVPGDLVGLEQGTRTGPNIMAFLFGRFSWTAREVKIAGAWLRGPEGAVKVRVVGHTNPRLVGYAPAPMAFVIPVLPLRPGTRYRGKVKFRIRSRTKSVPLSFTTGARDARSKKGHHRRHRGR